MDRQFYYIAIAFFGMVNGMFHPLKLLSFVVTSYFMSEPLFGSQSLIFYFSSLMLATATIILGGIPAAIYERFVGATDDSTDTSLLIWLAATALLTLPAIGRFFEVGL